jgi:hypothetical protein
MTENKNELTGLVLTAEQIQRLADFTRQDGQEIRPHTHHDPCVCC